MAMDEDMPEDALTEILSRLPVKSLLRFKSVSKHWYSLILQNPSFISLHHKLLPEKRIPPRPTISQHHFPIRPLYISPVRGLPQNPNPRSQPLRLFQRHRLSLQFLHQNHHVMQCNPAMREFRVLPQPSLHTRHTSHLGFAFDPKTNDYKVLRVAVHYYPEAFILTSVDGRVQIYEVSTDTWREIAVVVPKEIVLFPLSFCASLNGVFHWMAADRNGRGEIIAFHMSDELFERVFLPEDIRTNPRSSLSLSILGNSLALALVTVTVEFGRTESRIEIWARDGNGVKDPWNKKYSIGPIVGRYEALRFRQIGELLLLRRGNDWKMVSNNLDSHTLNEYEEYEDLKLVHRHQVLSYTV